MHRGNGTNKNSNNMWGPFHLNIGIFMLITEFSLPNTILEFKIALSLMIQFTKHNPTCNHIARSQKAPQTSVHVINLLSCPVKNNYFVFFSNFFSLVLIWVWVFFTFLVIKIPVGIFKLRSKFKIITIWGLSKYECQTVVSF